MAPLCQLTAGQSYGPLIARIDKILLRKSSSNGFVKNARFFLNCSATHPIKEGTVLACAAEFLNTALTCRALVLDCRSVAGKRQDREKTLMRDTFATPDDSERGGAANGCSFDGEARAAAGVPGIAFSCSRADAPVPDPGPLPESESPRPGSPSSRGCRALQLFAAALASTPPAQR